MLHTELLQLTGGFALAYVNISMYNVIPSQLNKPNCRRRASRAPPVAAHEKYRRIA